jgi:DNA-binding MarR family transcriptional regulator
MAVGDRRRSRLSLSAAGRRVHAKVVPLALELERKLLSSLDADDHIRLDKLLDKLGGSLAQLS